MTFYVFWVAAHVFSNTGAEWERGRKNTQFSANKSPYLRNGAR